jgi:hypothetical protein
MEANVISVGQCPPFVLILGYATYENNLHITAITIHTRY